MPNYTYPDSLTVKNKLGAATHASLEELESPLVAARNAEILTGHGPQGQFDTDHLKAIHKHLFQDVYEWAGRTRNEGVKLSDGSVATEPFLRKIDGSSFMLGNLIPAAMERVSAHLRDADFLRGLPKEEFAQRAADILAEINAIHPFREGNGRAQRAFIGELAREAGHELDFSVVSQERMVQASIAANEQHDPTMMRRLVSEISDPARTGALREAVDFLDQHNVKWRQVYLAIVEPGTKIEMTMAGISGENFLARTDHQIFVGKTVDLPTPHPESGRSFIHEASAIDREAYDQRAEATYFAKAVDDPIKHPPLHDDMRQAIEERRAYERAETAMRGGRAADREVSKQEQRELMEERIEAYLDRHKEISM